jgi:hypothetical protein
MHVNIYDGADPHRRIGSINGKGMTSNPELPSRIAAFNHLNSTTNSLGTVINKMP